MSTTSSTSAAQTIPPTTIGHVLLNGQMYDLTVTLLNGQGRAIPANNYPLPAERLRLIMNDVIFTAKNREEYLKRQVETITKVDPPSIT